MLLCPNKTENGKTEKRREEQEQEQEQSLWLSIERRLETSVRDEVL